MTINIATREDLLAIEEKLSIVIQKLSPSVSQSKEYYSTKELASLLKVSTKTVNNWRDQRLIEFFKVQNTIFFSSNAVEDFLNSHSIKRRK